MKWGLLEHMDITVHSVHPSLLSYLITSNIASPYVTSDKLFIHLGESFKKENAKKKSYK